MCHQPSVLNRHLLTPQYSYKLLYTASALCIIWLFLSLTPTLWNPTNWLSCLMFGLQAASEFSYMPDLDLIESLHNSDVSGRCLSFAEKENATAGPVDVVSGFYGPGTYLAWLVTAYVAAFSSIWHSKCAPSEERRERDAAGEGSEYFSLPWWGSQESADALDAEMAMALLYPLMALGDVFIRLVRCKIDPQMSAAVFVLFSALMIFGPTSRLSWQKDGVEPELEIFPRTKRSWAWKFSGFLIHGFVITLIGEPYAYTVELVIPVYVMLLVLTFFSLIRGERLSETYPYRTTAYWSRVVRIVVFTMMQIIFFSVALGKIGSLVPLTGSSLWDFDQIATLGMAIVTLMFFRTQSVGSLVSSIRHRLAGFRLLNGPETGSHTELTDIVIRDTEQ